MDGEQVDEGQVVDEEVSNLQQMFENINANNWIIKANRVDHLLAAIANHSTIDPQTLRAGDEPRDWDNAQWRPPKEVAEWKTTFKDEAKGLKDMGVYVLIPCSDVLEGIKIHRCKAVLKNKLNKNGNLAQCKVHFVFKGYEQEYGKDYTSTTSPTARMESWRILLHIAAALGWDA